MAVEEISAFQRLGFSVLLAFVFLAFSRIFDVKFGNLHITGLIYGVVLVMVFLSRAFVVALKSNIGKAILGLTICICISVPFSVWKGGSKAVFQTWLTIPFVAFLAVAGLVHNYQQWLKLFKTLAWALFAFSIIANVFGSLDTGRLYLSQGKFANPNEMAQALLLGLPLWGTRLVISKTLPGKAFAAGVMMLILGTAIRTGSRGAMIGFAVMIFVLFLRAPIMGRMQIMAAGFIFLLVVMTTMPGKLLSRYKTTLNEEAADVGEMDLHMADSALSSSQSRKHLLRNSLILTMQHPLLGVGVGMFEVAEDAYAKSTGLRKGSWLGTHNSYTQVSSEVGIPALLFFVGTIVMALKGSYSVEKQTRGDSRLDDIASVALGLQYCMIIYAVTVFFDHIAYTIMLPVFAGLAVSLVRTATAEIQRIQSTPAPVTMSPMVFHSALVAHARQGRA